MSLKDLEVNTLTSGGWRQAWQNMTLTKTTVLWDWLLVTFDGSIHRQSSSILTTWWNRIKLDTIHSTKLSSTKIEEFTAWRQRFSRNRGDSLLPVSFWLMIWMREKSFSSRDPSSLTPDPLRNDQQREKIAINILKILNGSVALLFVTSYRQKKVYEKDMKVLQL